MADQFRTWSLSRAKSSPRSATFRPAVTGAVGMAGTDGKASVKAAVPRTVKVASTATTKAEIVKTSRSPRNKGGHAVSSAPCASEVAQSERLGKARPIRNVAKHGSAIADPVGTAVMTSKMKPKSVDSSTMTVFLEHLGRREPVDMSPKETVSDLHEKAHPIISIKWKLNADESWLSDQSGRPLSSDDKRSLKAFGMVDGGQVKVNYRMRGGMDNGDEKIRPSSGKREVRTDPPPPVRRIWNGLRLQQKKAFNKMVKLGTTHWKNVETLIKAGRKDVKTQQQQCLHLVKLPTGAGKTRISTSLVFLDSLGYPMGNVVYVNPAKASITDYAADVAELGECIEKPVLMHGSKENKSSEVVGTLLSMDHKISDNDRDVTDAIQESKFVAMTTNVKQINRVRRAKYFCNRVGVVLIDEIHTCYDTCNTMREIFPHALVIGLTGSVQKLMEEMKGKSVEMLHESTIGVIKQECNGGCDPCKRDCLPYKADSNFLILNIEDATDLTSGRAQGSMAVHTIKTFLDPTSLRKYPALRSKKAPNYGGLLIKYSQNFPAKGKGEKAAQEHWTFVSGRVMIPFRTMKKELEKYKSTDGRNGSLAIFLLHTKALLYPTTKTKDRAGPDVGRSLDMQSRQCIEKFQKYNDAVIDTAFESKELQAAVQDRYNELNRILTQDRRMRYKTAVLDLLDPDIGNIEKIKNAMKGALRDMQSDKGFSVDGRCMDAILSLLSGHVQSIQLTIEKATYNYDQHTLRAVGILANSLEGADPSFVKRCKEDPDYILTSTPTLKATFKDMLKQLFGRPARAVPLRSSGNDSAFAIPIPLQQSLFVYLVTRQDEPWTSNIARRSVQLYVNSEGLPNRLEVEPTGSRAPTPCALPSGSRSRQCDLCQQECSPKLIRCLEKQLCHQCASRLPQHPKCKLCKTRRPIFQSILDAEKGFCERCVKYAKGCCDVFQCEAKNVELNLARLLYLCEDHEVEGGTCEKCSKNEVFRRSTIRQKKLLCGECKGGAGIKRNGMDPRNIVDGKRERTQKTYDYDEDDFSEEILVSYSDEIYGDVWLRCTVDIDEKVTPFDQSSDHSSLENTEEKTFPPFRKSSIRKYQQGDNVDCFVDVTYGSEPGAYWKKYTGVVRKVERGQGVFVEITQDHKYGDILDDLLGKIWRTMHPEHDPEDPEPNRHDMICRLREPRTLVFDPCEGFIKAPKKVTAGRRKTSKKKKRKRARSEASLAKTPDHVRFQKKKKGVDQDLMTAPDERSECSGMESASDICSGSSTAVEASSGASSRHASTPGIAERKKHSRRTKKRHVEQDPDYCPEDDGDTNFVFADAPSRTGRRTNRGSEWRRIDKDGKDTTYTEPFAFGESSDSSLPSVQPEVVDLDVGSSHSDTEGAQGYPEHGRDYPEGRKGIDLGFDIDTFQKEVEDSYSNGSSLRYLCAMCDVVNASNSEVAPSNVALARFFYRLTTIRDGRRDPGSRKALVIDARSSSALRIVDNDGKFTRDVDAKGESIDLSKVDYQQFDLLRGRVFQPEHYRKFSEKLGSKTLSEEDIVDRLKEIFPLDAPTGNVRGSSMEICGDSKARGSEEKDELRRQEHDIYFNRIFHLIRFDALGKAAQPIDKNDGHWEFPQAFTDACRSASSTGDQSRDLME